MLKYKNIIGFFAMACFVINAATVSSAEENLYADMQNEYVDTYQIFQGETLKIEPESVIEEKGEVTEASPEWSYAFTAPRDGQYRLEIIDPRQEITLNVSDAWGNTEKYYQNAYSFEAKEGDAFTFTVNYYHGNTDFLMRIYIQQPSVELAEGVTNIEDAMSFKGQINRYYYTAPSNGRYYFETKCQASNATIDTYIFSEDGSQVTESFTYNSWGESITLDQGTKYEIVVQKKDGVGPYYVKIGEPQPTIDITGYTSVSDVFEYSKQTNWYAFTAPVTGTYQISYQTESGDDIEVYLLDDSYNDKEDFKVSNFRWDRNATVNLEEGKTYYLGAYRYSNNVRSYQLGIAYPIGAENMVITPKAQESDSEGTESEEAGSEETDFKYKDLATANEKITQLEQELEALQEKYDLLVQIIGDSGVKIEE